MIEAADGRLYTGITTDTERRFAEHLAQAGLGAKFFRGNKPVALVYRALCADRSRASKEEARIKKLKRQQKLALVDAYRQGSR